MLGGRINYSGGNPLLRSDFEEVLRRTNEAGIVPCILGNPFPLTDDNVDMLVRNNVFRYQVSLDGLKDTHDSFRGEGSFDQTIQGIQKLSRAGIWVTVMGTVSSVNMHEMPDVAEVSFHSGASHFDFARLVPIGAGEQFKDSEISARDYRAFLFGMYKKYRDLRSEGAPTHFFGTKDPLWNLLFFESGLLEPIGENRKPYGGCSIGKNGLCIDVDGEVYSCRRLPLSIGNVRRDSLYYLFIGSDMLNQQRNFSLLEKCADCEVMPVCRGCRAIAHADSGDYYAADPQCWREE